MTSSSVPCPFCGEMMTPPIKFCVGCGRGISAEDLKNSGLKVGIKRGDNGGKFALAKKEYSMHRKMRGMFWSTTAVMALVLGYYMVMKYGLNEEPWLKWEGMIQRVMAGKPPFEPAPLPQVADPAGATAATTVAASSASKPAPKPANHRKTSRKSSKS